MTQLPGWANWLARDEGGRLYAFEKRPYRTKSVWISGGKHEWKTEDSDDYSHVQWSDSEPTPISVQPQTNLGPVTDTVRPNHYKGKKDLIASWQDTMSDEEFRGAMKALISRYHMRYDRKNGIEDLDKATECIRRLKEWEESKNGE